MITINEDNASENKPFSWSTFASDLGLRPGQFPEMLETELGNGRPFVRCSVSPDGSVVMYRQDLGCCNLHVYND